MGTSVGNMLGSNISQATRIKILNGEYIDLSVFLENHHDPDGSQNLNTHSMGMGTGKVWKCFDFNYKGSCFRNPCRYQHSCLKCNGEHASYMCHANNFQHNSASTGNLEVKPQQI
ncbi:uncharacterized protein LOC110442851 [Mizuhopecten yessoensis]|uniref:uncharacterized protein LOC110442851 n=1 Tax=Mizuhopecten yessoensis TaxID=6573 RepID=UPI000B457EB9|nr:uncharacterized protein LOC110442851 [Mizuhopecten yessoensis]